MKAEIRERGGYPVWPLSDPDYLLVVCVKGRTVQVPMIRESELPWALRTAAELLEK